MPFLFYTIFFCFFHLSFSSLPLSFFFSFSLPWSFYSSLTFPFCVFSFSCNCYLLPTSIFFSFSSALRIIIFNCSVCFVICIYFFASFISSSSLFFSSCSLFVLSITFQACSNSFVSLSFSADSWSFLSSSNTLIYYSSLLIFYWSISLRSLFVLMLNISCTSILLASTIPSKPFICLSFPVYLCLFASVLSTPIPASFLLLLSDSSYFYDSSYYYLYSFLFCLLSKLVYSCLFPIFPHPFLTLLPQFHPLLHLFNPSLYVIFLFVHVSPVFYYNYPV